MTRCRPAFGTFSRTCSLLQVFNQTLFDCVQSLEQEISRRSWACLNVLPYCLWHEGRLQRKSRRRAEYFRSEAATGCFAEAWAAKLALQGTCFDSIYGLDSKCRQLAKDNQHASKSAQFPQQLAAGRTLSTAPAWESMPALFPAANDGPPIAHRGTSLCQASSARSMGPSRIRWWPSIDALGQRRGGDSPAAEVRGSLRQCRPRAYAQVVCP